MQCCLSFSFRVSVYSEHWQNNYSLSPACLPVCSLMKDWLIDWLIEWMNVSLSHVTCHEQLLSRVTTSLASQWLLYCNGTSPSRDRNIIEKLKLWIRLTAETMSFCRATRMHSADNAVARCLSVGLSVTRRYSVDIAEHIFNFFTLM